jgi:glucosamine--fructose-6-phosphate aminotransferase (isomerizing)
MTRFLQDILRQPDEMNGALKFLSGAGRVRLEEAANAIRNAPSSYLTGIGASWNAALSASMLFHLGARAVYLQDAAELLHFSTLPPGAVVAVISRSGRSIEIVKLLAKARDCGATVIGITNSEDGPLAREASIPLIVPATLDHGISVNTYSTLAIAAAALASVTTGVFDSDLVQSMWDALADTSRILSTWHQQLAETTWLKLSGIYYFLARGCSIGSCHEARLLWEEGAKSPATAMGTSTFRHGPQEMTKEGTRFGIWIDGESMREQDLVVARDLRQLGASVMLIGQRLREDAADLVFQLPEVPANWQFLIDIIPAQLAAESLARLSGVDPDSFNICSYIVEDESGLLGKKVAGR